MVTNTEQIIDNLFRKEYGKLIASLTRFFGPANIQLAEDIVQETLIAACENWGAAGIPENPTGWLIQVAKRKAINELKRKKVIERHNKKEVLSSKPANEIGSVLLEGEIADNLLRMIFTCCHPAISPKSQVALTLKTLCGFGVKEVAKALLTTESTINKRLYRAKSEIRKGKVVFDIPSGKELMQRLDSVNLTLYLLFNEGYNSSSGEMVIQKEMCLEAIRLTRLLCKQFEDHKKSYALLSLMYFHAARFEARIDDRGTIILFEDQDRAKWDKDLINLGMQFLQKSMDDLPSSFHIEAGIAAEHCLAKNFKETDWQSIYRQYQLLEELKPNPIIKLNLAIIQSKIEGYQTSLKELENLSNNESLINYHLLPATQGIFHMKLGDYESALICLERAKKLNPSGSEYKFIDSKIEECKRNS